MWRQNVGCRSIFKLPWDPDVWVLEFENFKYTVQIKSHPIMNASTKFTVTMVIIACLGEIANAFCWGPTDHSGHCTGLGTSPGDVDYEKMGFFNTIASAQRFKGGWHDSNVNPGYAPTPRALSFAWEEEHKRKYGI
jgi:hypothetical protein